MKKVKKENYCLPKKINLLGRTYRIKLSNCRCKKCDHERLGSVDFKKKIIELHKDLDEKEAKYVLFHELAHVFADYYNLENGEIFAEAFTRYVGSIFSQLKY